MISLTSLVRAQRAKLLLQGDADGLEDLGRVLRLRELSLILSEEEKLRRHQLTEGELPFDRLLLATSKNYRRTRELAHGLGVELRAEYVSPGRGFYTFDPARDWVPYTPLRTELAWLLRQPWPARKLWRAFTDLRAYVVPAFHELNHAITYQLVQPSDELRAHPRAQKIYFYLTEALVWMRDLQLLDELGLASFPLLLCGSIYQAPGITYVPGRMTFEKFRHSLDITYSRYMGDRRYGRLGRPDDWIIEYSRGHGNAIVLPKRRRTKLPRLAAPGLLPSELRNRPAELRRIYDWYMEVFGKAPVATVLDKKALHKLYLKGV